MKDVIAFYYFLEDHVNNKCDMIITLFVSNCSNNVEISTDERIAFISIWKSLFTGVIVLSKRICLHIGTNPSQIQLNIYFSLHC